MNFTKFPWIATFLLYVLSSGFLSAANQDDIDSDITYCTSFKRFFCCCISDDTMYSSIPRPVVSDIAIPEVARGYEEVYRRFLGGKLIYTDPTSKSTTELPIRALTNPLEGTFDLSGCGDAGKYLSICTGYRKAQKPENADKIEIWLAPRFLVERDLATTAKHLQPIMGSWEGCKAPVGLFWTYGGWSDLGWYDYLVTDSFGELASEDLWKKCRKSCISAARAWYSPTWPNLEAPAYSYCSCFVFELK